VKEKRYRLVQDDDGHWYCIEADQADAFEKWEAAAPYWENYKGPDFTGAAVCGSPSSVTFTRPRADS
jgi:hypothetical protein